MTARRPYVKQGSTRNNRISQPQRIADSFGACAGHSRRNTTDSRSHRWPLKRARLGPARWIGWPTAFDGVNSSQLAARRLTSRPELQRPSTAYSHTDRTEALLGDVVGSSSSISSGRWRRRTLYRGLWPQLTAIQFALGYEWSANGARQRLFLVISGVGIRTRRAMHSNLPSGDGKFHPFPTTSRFASARYTGSFELHRGSIGCRGMWPFVFHTQGNVRPCTTHAYDTVPFHVVTPHEDTREN
jgi:hypothetical protein